MNSFKVSLEWRIIAFVITNIFFWVISGEFWQATGIALLLQGILFAAHFVWVLLRYKH